MIHAQQKCCMSVRLACLARLLYRSALMPVLAWTQDTRDLYLMAWMAFWDTLATQEQISLMHLKLLSWKSWWQWGVLLKTDHVPVNRAPRSRHWGKLNRFNTTLNYCDIKQRRCKELGCPSAIRYIRPNKTNIVLVQHIGIHNCSPSPLYGQINLPGNNEKIISDMAFNKDTTDDLQKRQSHNPQKRKAQILVDLIFYGSTSKRRQLSDLSSTSEKIIAPQNKKRVRFRNSDDLNTYANESCVEPKRRKINMNHLTSANDELLQEDTNTSKEQSSQLPIDSSNGCYGSDIDALEIDATAYPLLSTSLEKEVQVKQDVDVVFQLDGDREWRGTGLSSKKKIAGNTFCNWGHKVCSSQKETFKRNRRVKYVCKACKSEVIEKRKRKYRSCRA